MHRSVAVFKEIAGGMGVLSSLLFAATALAAGAQSEVNSNVAESTGSFSHGIELSIPEFHGLEPDLSLQYDSTLGNGVAGVGWRMAGVSEIVRASKGRGTPFYDSTDIFLLDGQELKPCPSNAGPEFPGCETASGGTHYTRMRTQQRIAYDSGANKWTVTGPDGTQRIYEQSYGVLVGGNWMSWKYGIKTVRDVQKDGQGNHVNVVTYNWGVNDAATGSQCCYEYLDSISYGDFVVDLAYETRSDIETQATGQSLRQQSVRLHTVSIYRGTTVLGAYRFTYSTSGSTGRSLLASVTQYGTDATFDTNGLVTGGTTMPAETFTYQSGTANLTSKVFSSTMASQLHVNPTAFRADDAILGGDFNGDGYSDVAAISPRGPSGKGWHQRIKIQRGRSNARTAGLGFVNVKTNLPVHIRNGNGNGSQTKQFFFMTGDFNGDGKTDIAAISPDAAGSWDTNVFVELGTLDGFSARTWSGGSIVSTIHSNPTKKWQIFAADMDADGKDDIVAIAPANGATTAGWLRSTGSGFQVKSIPTNIGAHMYNGGSTKDYRTFPMDVNGDGAMDLYTVSIDGTGSWATQNLLTLNKGDGETSTESWFDSYMPERIRSGGTTNRYYFHPGDFNGDGKTDLAVYSPDASTGTYAWNSKIFVDMAYGNTMLSREFPADLPQHMRNGGSSSKFYNLQGDLDGDRKTDLFAFSYDGGGDWGYGTFVNLSRDHGLDSNAWGMTSAWPDWAGTIMPEEMHALSSWRFFHYRPGDYDGDGLNDIFIISPTAGTASSVNWSSQGVLDFRTGKVPDLLVSTLSPGGATTTISYKPITTYNRKAHTDWEPSPMSHLVSAVTVNDGLGNTSTTSYDYIGPNYDRKERHFLGFSKVNVRHPRANGDPYDSYSSTWTNFPANCGGAAYTARTQEWRDEGDANPLSETIVWYDFNCTESAGAIYFELAREEASVYEPGTANKITSKKEFAHDGYGNRTVVIDHGLFSRSDNGGGAAGDLLKTYGDETYTQITYSHNTTDFVIGVVKEQKVFKGIDTYGQLLQHTRHYYDCNPTPGSDDCSFSATPSKGMLAKTDVWVDRAYEGDSSGGSYIVTDRRTYDTQGNVLGDWDELGGKVTHAYDSNNPAMVTSTTNALNHQMTYVYGTVGEKCGAPTSVTDANGIEVESQYDVFCRVTREDNNETGDYTIHVYNPNQSNVASQYNEVKRKGPSTADIWTREYYNGIGQVWRKKSSGDVSTGASRVVDSEYDERGNVKRVSLPYADGTSSGSILWSSTEYDFANRPVKVTLSDGATTTTQYGATTDCSGLDCLFATTVVDANGGKARVIKDEEGQLVQRSEYNSSNIFTSGYEYDVLGNAVWEMGPTGVVNTTSYNSLGHALSKEDADHGTVYYTYDAKGNVLTAENHLGEVTSFSYDTLGRKTAHVTNDEMGSISPRTGTKLLRLWKGAGK